MPPTHPWLLGPPPTDRLPRTELEERILHLLASQNMAVVATTSADGSPAATPVRYSHLGFEICWTSWNDSVKSRNLRRDPRVSVAVFAPLVGPASSRGAQLFGSAVTLERDDPRADRYWGAQPQVFETPAGTRGPTRPSVGRWPNSRAASACSSAGVTAS